MYDVKQAKFLSFKAATFLTNGYVLVLSLEYY